MSCITDYLHGRSEVKNDMSGELIPSSAPAVFPVRWFAPSPKGAKRVFEFFTTQTTGCGFLEAGKFVRNPRRA